MRNSFFYVSQKKKQQHRATVVKWRREDSEGTLRRGVFGAHIKAMDQHGEESVMERRLKASAYVDIKWLFFALFSAAFIMLYLPSPPVDDDDRAATLSSASCDSLMCLRALVESFHVSDETHFGMTKATMRWGENKSQNNIENMIRFIFIALFTVIVFSPSHTIKRVARVSFFFNLFGGNAVRLLLWSVMGVMWCGGGRRDDADDHLEFDFYTGKILHFRFFWYCSMDFWYRLARRRDSSFSIISLCTTQRFFSSLVSHVDICWRRIQRKFKQTVMQRKPAWSKQWVVKEPTPMDDVA